MGGKDPRSRFGILDMSFLEAFVRGLDRFGFSGSGEGSGGIQRSFLREGKSEGAADEGSFFAFRASLEVDYGEVEKEFLPGLGVNYLLPLWLGQGLIVSVWRFHLQDEGRGRFQFRSGIDGREKAVVADFDEAGGQHVEEEAADELLGG